MSVLLSLWHGLSGRKAAPGPKRSLSEQAEQDLRLQITAAHREWQAAQQYFQSVTEPQLVDHAVHAIIAAEQKYMFLLKQLRGDQGHVALPGEPIE